MYRPNEKIHLDKLMFIKFYDNNWKCILNWKYIYLGKIWNFYIIGILIKGHMTIMIKFTTIFLNVYRKYVFSILQNLLIYKLNGITLIISIRLLPTFKKIHLDKFRNWENILLIKGKIKFYDNYNYNLNWKSIYTEK